MAKAQSFENLMFGGAVVAGGLLLWANRAKLGLGTPAAASGGSTGGTGATGGGGTDFFTGTVPGTRSVGPLLTAPVPIAPVITTLPNSLVNVQPTLSVAPITQTAGCVIGPWGGLVCPDVPAAQVLTAQTDCALPPSSSEISTCMGRKPTWTRDYAVGRLTQYRQAYCAGKAALAAGDTSWISAMQGDKTDYYNLTGVYLT
jgi:hypothetical protein